MVASWLNWWLSEVKHAFIRKKKLKLFDLNTSLNRCLSTCDLIAIGLGSMTGVGIFILPGILSKMISGPALIVSHFIAAVISMLNAIIYSELSTQFPKCGSIYIYGYVSIGEVGAFFVGWSILMEYTISVSAVNRGFGATINFLSSNAISNATIKYIGLIHIESQESYPDFIAGALILILALVTLSGIRISSNLNIILTVFNYALILFISITCLVYMRPDSYAPQDKGGFAPFGFSGVLKGAAMSFFIYVGFDAISVNSEEAKTPRTSLPVANIASISILCIAVVLSGGSLNLFTPWNETDIASPFSEAFKSRGLIWASYIASIGIISCLVTNSFIHLVSAPKLLYSFSNDGLICECFSYLIPKTKVPVWSTLLISLFILIMAIVFPLESLVEFVNAGCLVCYMAACLIITVLRYSYQLEEPAPSSSLNNIEQCDSVIRAGELSLKYRNIPLFKPLTHLPPRKTPIVSMLLYTLFVLILNIFLKFNYIYLIEIKWWAIVIVIGLGIMAIICMIITSFYEQGVPKNTFKVPFIPIYSCITLFLNSLLLVNVSLRAFIAYSIWIFCGAVIYFCYGMFHSKLRDKANTDQIPLVRETSSHNYSTISDNVGRNEEK